MTVQIPDPVIQQIEAFARARFPDEACGLLVGRRADDAIKVFGARESQNIAANPRSHFEVDPGLRLRLQRELRDQGSEIVGVFHSHPSGDPAPSKTDSAAIWEPDLLWLITAVDQGAVGVSKAYAVDDTDTGLSFRQVTMERA
ncbi:MAG: M67 family metallopeptidase [Alphaproteobacteria bacterium]|nr:M67 family metallopeptidase [Alphaproteobacteria bacterium]